jgi:hypothetical protein
MRRMTTLRFLVVAILIVSGCTRGDSPDGGPGFDGARPDARLPDARVPDGGRRDGGGMDSGASDGGGMDGEVADGNVDAPMGDAGPLPATWTTTASAHPCPASIGMRYMYVCPPGGTEDSIWGTEIHTYDSSICTAAVHAGRITFAAGGTIEIEILDGQASYLGSTRNGVTSSSYTAYTCSFSVVAPACLATHTACGMTCGEFMTDSQHCGDCDTVCASGSCVASACEACPGGEMDCGGSCVDTTSDPMNCGACGTMCSPTEYCIDSMCGIDWFTSASGLGIDCADAGVLGMNYDFTCPAAGTAGSVWGTDTYTHDSRICTAAVHAGRITLAAGGDVTIQMTPGAAMYTGSTRNGITSLDYGTWSCSYIFP